MGIIDENRKETKYEISQLDDIYKYSEQLIKVITRLMKGDKTKNSEEQLLKEAN